MGRVELVVDEGKFPRHCVKRMSGCWGSRLLGEEFEQELGEIGADRRGARRPAGGMVGLEGTYPLGVDLSRLGLHEKTMERVDSCQLRLSVATGGS